MSSYSEILRDMVEDEFELTVDPLNPGYLRNKITLKPFELKYRHNVNSLLQETLVSYMENSGHYSEVFHNVAQDSGYNHEIDGLIMAGQTYNPHKRMK